MSLKLVSGVGFDSILLLVRIRLTPSRMIITYKPIKNNSKLLQVSFTTNLTFLYLPTLTLPNTWIEENHFQLIPAFKPRHHHTLESAVYLCLEFSFHVIFQKVATSRMMTCGNSWGKKILLYALIWLTRRVDYSSLLIIETQPVWEDQICQPRYYKSLFDPTFFNDVSVIVLLVQLAKSTSTNGEIRQLVKDGPVKFEK